MRLLGVDTSSSRASVAITTNGRLISENVSAEVKHSNNEGRSRNNHAEVLLSLIDATLATAGLRLGDLSGFGVTIGPGSFTGLRIGLSTIKGLSYGSAIPVVGVSTLHACAFRVSHFNGSICAILDARKNEIYAALFRRHDGLLERITPDQVMPFQQLVDFVGALGCGGPILLTGDGIRQYGELLLHALGKQIFLSENALVPTLASAAALLGEVTLSEGQGASPAPLSLRYLRAADAETRMRKFA
jgi:tRNA threonylcarbamoyladenosine biosynthesis protein TsaB